jgi:transposase
MERYGPSGKVSFMPCIENQATLLPHSLDDLVPKDHLVRTINDAIERMNIDPLLAGYKGGGTSSYHPKMLLKVIVYAYTERLYTTRRIAKALRENVYMMWLSGMSRPDFRTIARFRSSRLKPVIDQVLMSLMDLLVEEWRVRLEIYFLDGSKLEANANRYTHVWAKNVGRHKENVQIQIK